MYHFHGLRLHQVEDNLYIYLLKLIRKLELCFYLLFQTYGVAALNLYFGWVHIEPLQGSV